MNLNWLHDLRRGPDDACIAPIQVAYLVALVVGAVLLAIIGRRSRDFSTSTLSADGGRDRDQHRGRLDHLRAAPADLPRFDRDRARRRAGRAVGRRADRHPRRTSSGRSCPIPGGAGPTAAFFAPVAGVIGLMAGFWASRGVFQLRTDDARVGGFLALAAGFAAAVIALLRRPGHDRPAPSTPADPNSQNRFVRHRRR